MTTEHTDVTIPGAAIEAALKAFEPALFGDDPVAAHMAASPIKVDIAQARVRAKIGVAINAAVPFLALSGNGGAAPVAVKALRWTMTASDEWMASSIFGAYDFTIYSEGDPAFVFKRREFPTLEAAKAAAQADYDQRIRSALLTPPAAAKDDTSQREGIEAAARIAREKGNIANMLWNDNVEPDKHLIIRETAFDIEKGIRALAHPAPVSPAETTPARAEVIAGKVEGLTRAWGILGVHVAYAKDQIRNQDAELGQKMLEWIESIRKDIMREKIRAANPDMGPEDLTDQVNAALTSKNGNAELIERLTKTPLIEGLTPSNHEWDACETVQDRYDLMKRKIREANHDAE